jgi:hypothetical protein
MNFTGGNGGNQNNMMFKPLEMTKQEKLMEGKGDNLKIRTKQEIEEGKRRQEEKAAQE